MWDLCSGMQALHCSAQPSLVVVGQFSLSSCGAGAPERMGSAVCGTWALSLRRAASVVVMHGLGSCGARA